MCHKQFVRTKIMIKTNPLMTTLQVSNSIMEGLIHVFVKQYFPIKGVLLVYFETLKGFQFLREIKLPRITQCFTPQVFKKFSGSY